MEGVTLSVADLATVFGPMFAVVFALMRYQHLDSTKTRELMHRLIGDSNRETRELIEQSNKENRELIEQSNKENRDLIKENRELIEKNHQELTGSLGEVRERLAHIEGFLGSAPPPYDGDAEAA